MFAASSSATDAAIQKKMFGSGCRPWDLASPPSDLASHATTLIISNEEMNDLLVSKTIKNEAKEQKGGFLGLLLGTLGASLLGNLITR